MRDRPTRPCCYAERSWQCTGHTAPRSECVEASLRVADNRAAAAERGCQRNACRIWDGAGRGVERQGRVGRKVQLDLHGHGDDGVLAQDAREPEHPDLVADGAPHGTRQGVLDDGNVQRQGVQQAGRQRLGYRQWRGRAAGRPRRRGSDDGIPARGPAPLAPPCAPPPQDPSSCTYKNIPYIAILKGI